MTCVLNTLMRRAYYAVKSGDWENSLEEFLNGDRLSVWASVKVRECCNEVESEDEGSVSNAQDIPRESMDFLWKIIAPSDSRRSHSVVRVPSSSLFSA